MTTPADRALTASAPPGRADPEASAATPPVPTPSPSERRFGLGLALVTALGFAWRLGFTLVTKGSDRQLFDEGDGFFYSNVARALASGHLYVNPFNGAPAADHPPLTVLVLAPASWLFSGSVLAQRLTMTLIGTITIVAIGLLARSVAGAAAGLAAAAIAAADPNLWVNDAVIMSESISALLIVATLASGFALARRPTLGRAAAAGAVCGVTVLARAEMGLFLPLMIAPLLLRPSALAWPARIGRVALAAAALGLVLAPWTIWNLSRFHDPVFLSTNDGTTLLGANCPATFDSNITGGWSLTCVLHAGVAGLDASQASTRQRQLALDYVKAHPGRIPVVLVAREGRTLGFWRPDQSVYINQGEGRPRWASWLAFATFWALIPVSVAGVRGLRRRGVTLVPMGASLATVVVVSALFYGIPRFRLPLDVAMVVLAGVAAADAADWVRRRPGDRAGAVAPGGRSPTT